MRPVDLKIAPPPARLDGKEFESLLMEAAVRHADQVLMKRYGTEVRWIAGQQKATDSYCDFDMVYRDGRQAVIEAKVTKEASFSLAPDKFKPSQFQQMEDKTPYNVPCWLIIHFCQRKLTTKDDPAITIRVDVKPESDLWCGYKDGTIKSINRELALANGREIDWVIPRGCTKALPYFFGLY